MSKFDFAGFFRGLWGFKPFTWQCELANRVVSRTIDDASFSPKEIWPKAITVPTGAGKTACIEIAIFAMAAAANSKKSPLRRVFFVVDRRVIVDDAYGRAVRISQKLAEAKQGILKDVADHLLELNPQCHQEARTPLAAFALRGGKPLYEDDKDPFWNPLQPAVIASTVDQIGSRLLFRGYGCSKRSRPIYAGLIAKDSLIILDEAHCSNPFMQTLDAIENLERNFTRTNLGINTPTVIMSATPQLIMKEDTFQLDLEANHEDVLEQRLAVSKIAELKEVKTKSFEIECANAAKRLVNKNKRLRNIVVFVNLVATARAVYRFLKKEYGTNAVILTGRMRPLDKDGVVAAKLDHLRPENQDKRSSQDDPLFVISTQTLEVGADLDFDGLVSECSSLDSLRQRFGRLNRTGRSIDARAIILMRDRLETTDKYVYEESLEKTWKMLNDNKDSDNTVDFGIKSKQLPNDPECIAPSLDAPIILPAHLDSLVQTEIEPKPSPVVANFLHGERDNAPDVQVCWRADFDLTDEKGQEAAKHSLRLCPPRSGELVSVPINIFIRWFVNDKTEDESVDIEGLCLFGGMDGGNSKGSQKKQKSSAAPDAENAKAYTGRRTTVSRNFALIQRQKEVDETVICFNVLGHSLSKKDISPGDVIVIQTHELCDWECIADLYTENKDTEGRAIGLDIGDRASYETKGIPILRIHKSFVSSWPTELAEAKKIACDLIVKLPEYRRKDDEETPLQQLKELLKKLSSAGSNVNDSSTWNWLPKVAENLRKSDERLLRDAIAESSSDYLGLILVGKRHNIKSKRTREIELDDHLRGVMDMARIHSSHSSLLPQELIEAISLAGRLHDIGKADSRFQSRMRGGVEWAGGKLLAKASPKYYSKYPKGSRHELISVQMIDQQRSLLDGTAPELHDLILHLIASHHGYCRPFVPETHTRKELVPVYYNGHAYSCSEPTGLEKLDSGVSGRFWRLVREYGWWGLAWLEALLRLADWRCSSQE